MRLLKSTSRITPATAPGTRRARRRDSVATREALIAAGTELFAERGYDGVPVSAIAGKAGVNKAMINYHFGGKRKLYLAILTATFAEIVAGVERLAESSRPAPEVLRELVAMVGEVATRRHPALLHDDAARGGRGRQAPGVRGAGQAGAHARRRAAHRGPRGPRGRLPPGRSLADPPQPRRQPRVLLRHPALPRAGLRQATPRARAA